MELRTPMGGIIGETFCRYHVLFATRSASGSTLFVARTASPPHPNESSTNLERSTRQRERARTRSMSMTLCAVLVIHTHTYFRVRVCAHEPVCVCMQSEQPPPRNQHTHTQAAAAKRNSSNGEWRTIFNCLTCYCTRAAQMFGMDARDAATRSVCLSVHTLHAQLHGNCKRSGPSNKLTHTRTRIKLRRPRQLAVVAVVAIVVICAIINRCVCNGNTQSDNNTIAWWQRRNWWSY